MCLGFARLFCGWLDTVYPADCFNFKESGSYQTDHTTKRDEKTSENVQYSFVI